MSKKCTPLWCEAHLQVKKQKNTAHLDHFWKLRCRKSARCCGAKHKFEVKTHRSRTTFGSWDVEKVHAVVARSTFRSQHVKSTSGSDHFWTFRCRFARQAQGSKVSKTWEGFVAFPKKDGRRGTFEEDLERCIFRGRHNTRDMFIRAVRRSERWFPEKVCIWSLRSSGLLRWFCVTGAALRMTWHHFFVAGAVV